MKQTFLGIMAMASMSTVPSTRRSVGHSGPPVPPEAYKAPPRYCDNCGGKGCGWCGQLGVMTAKQRREWNRACDRILDGTGTPIERARDLLRSGVFAEKEPKQENVLTWFADHDGVHRLRECPMEEEVEVVPVLATAHLVELSDGGYWEWHAAGKRGHLKNLDKAKFAAEYALKQEAQTL